MKAFALTALIFASLFAAQQAEANCAILLRIRNTGSKSLYIYNNPNDERTAVKNVNGYWRSLAKGDWLDHETVKLYVSPGGGITEDIYMADFSCNYSRRYRINYKCIGGPNNEKWFTQYYPSLNGSTTAKQIEVQIGNCTAE
ncbi:MAG TPA: hypothetical protein VIH99_10195 [Bdellovibrionota bacterium]|jgi:hypothetical protein